MGASVLRGCPRVVIDTNLIVSALIFGGQVARLRLLWQQAQCVPLVSRETTLELIRVLAYPKFRLTPEEQEELLSDYLLFGETVTLPEVLPQTPACRDPDDVPFLVLALVGRADYLITGDQDLLSLQDEFVCPIVTLEGFLQVIGAGELE